MGVLMLEREERAPVLDCEGFPVHRVRVTANEMTCLDCGETTTSGFCARCSGDDDPDAIQRKGYESSRLVPTISYLREGEYVLV